MSHFTVLVIGDNFEAQLAPYHEFECTGKDNKYVQDIDKTEEAREEYAKATERFLIGPNGEREHPYHERFYRELTQEEAVKNNGIFNNLRGVDSRDWGDGQGYRPKIRYVPDGWKEQTISSSEVVPFALWCKEYYGWKTCALGSDLDLEDKHKYGYVLVDADGTVIKCVDRTNPNAKWDWYEVGGRWTGFFPLKPNTKGTVGRPGVMTAVARNGTADCVRKGNVDFEGARNEAEVEGRRFFAKWRAIFEQHGKPKGWESFRTRLQDEEERLKKEGTLEQQVTDNNGNTLNPMQLFTDKMREEYREQAAIAAAKNTLNMWECPVDEIGFDEEAYIKSCRNQALVPFAVVKDGKWYARGDMGWWGIVTDEKDTSRWQEEVSRLYDDLPDDTLLTLVDCHI